MCHVITLETDFWENKQAALCVCGRERAWVHCAPSFFAVGLLGFSDSSCSTHTCAALWSANQVISSQDVVNRKYSSWSTYFASIIPFWIIMAPCFPLPILLPLHPVRHPSPFFIKRFILFHEIHVFFYIHLMIYFTQY